jgi:hypothetical protein
MTDRAGDKTKQPEGCNETPSTCPNIKERDDHDMSGETYHCDVCGAHYYLDYDDMR